MTEPLNYPQRKRDNTKSKTPNRDVNAAQRVQLALKCKAAGMTLDEIAAQAGYGSRGAAHNAIKRELQRNMVPNVEEMRAHEALILEQLHKRCMSAAMNESNKGFLFAVDRVIAIRERWCKLFGLDVQPEQAVAANMVVVRELPPGYLQLPAQEQVE
jgi:hypothetical protein